MQYFCLQLPDTGKYESFHLIRPWMQHRDRKKGTSCSLCWLFKGHTVLSLLCTSLSCGSFSYSSVLRSCSYFHSILVNILQQGDDSPSLPALILHCHVAVVMCCVEVLFCTEQSLLSRVVRSQACGHQRSAVCRTGSVLSLYLLGV